MSKPWRARIPPNSPRGQHTFSGGDTYKKVDGWYAISDGEKEILGKVKLHDMSPASGPLFQIVTPDEAVALDRSEASRRKGTGKAGIDPKTGLPIPEEADAGDKAIRDELDAARTNGERLARELGAARADTAELSSKVDTLLGALAKLSPELAAALFGGATGPTGTSGGATGATGPTGTSGGATGATGPTGDAKGTDEGEDRSTRPGARGGATGPRGGATGPRGGAKGDAASKGATGATGPRGDAKGTDEGDGPSGPLASQGVVGNEADPTGAKAAVEGVDKKVADELAARPR